MAGKIKQKRKPRYRMEAIVGWIGRVLHGLLTVLLSILIVLAVFGGALLCAEK